MKRVTILKRVCKKRWACGFFSNETQYVLKYDNKSYCNVDVDYTSTRLRIKFEEVLKTRSKYELCKFMIKLSTHTFADRWLYAILKEVVLGD